jgi:clan AA aspartic protease
MMIGSVRARHVLLPVTFRLAGMSDRTIEFVVDTGFTGLLNLPPDIITAMNLPFLHRIPAQLADGSFVELAVHSASIIWKGIEAEARVLATGERPLLGTALLDGSELLAQFREEGLVTVDDL